MTAKHSTSQKPRRRILVMRYRFIGDTLLTVPFLRNLRGAYPDAVIDVLVGPNSGELLRDCPYINELIFYDTTRKHRYENSEQKPRTFWAYVSELKARKYDTAFVLKRSFSSAALAFLAGIPERIGFATEGRNFLLTQSVPYSKTRPEAECFLDVLRATNIPVQDQHLESWWNEAESSRVNGLLEGGGKQVVLHLSSSNRIKELPETQGKALAGWLLTHDGITVHALGAVSDRAQYETLKQQLPKGLRDRLHIHCGDFSLHESMAFLSKMDLVVGVDSGTLHMAAAAGAPVVALFGPTDPLKWGPANATIVGAERNGTAAPSMAHLDLEKVKTACQTHLNC